LIILGYWVIGLLGYIFTINKLIYDKIIFMINHINL
jgi:hypothetical protein